MARLPAAAIALALILGCSSVPPTPRTSPTSDHGDDSVRAYALLGNGHLLVANIEDGTVLRELVLAASSPQILTQVHAMALSADKTMLYVLVQDASRTGRIAVVDTATQQVFRTLEVGSGADYRSLGLGRRTGSLYVFGNEGAAAAVWVVDPTGRASPRRHLARPASGGSWFVYQGLVAADETALFLSYHGDTTGVDRFELKDGTLMRCPQGPQPDQGCFRIHGGIGLFGDRLLATTGESGLLVLDQATGATVGRYDTALEGNHVMEFVLDEVSKRAYVIGSCGYSRGLATIDLEHGTTQVLAPARVASSPCGERLAVAPDGDRLVVARTALPVPSVAGPGALVILSTAGAPLREIATSAEPIDLLVFPLR